MADHSDHLGPGEQTDPDTSPGEAHNAPTPDGHLPRGCSDSDPRAQAHETTLVAQRKDQDSRDSAECAPKRRTGTDRDGYETVTPFDHALEQRRDHSAGDLLRETVFDPAQDNTGPQSDKG